MYIEEILKALADPNRIRILNLLYNQALCVCDIETVLGLNQSNLSRHLAKLRRAGLVKAEKKGMFIYYSRLPIAEPYRVPIESLFDALQADPTWESDRLKFQARSC